MTIIERMEKLLEGAKKEYFIATLDSEREVKKAGGIHPGRDGKVYLWKKEREAQRWGEGEYGYREWWVYTVDLDPSQVEQDPDDSDGVIYRKTIPYKEIVDVSHIRDRED